VRPTVALALALIPFRTASADTGAFAPCPPGVVCVASFPYVDSGSTVGGTRDLDAYACAPGSDESGPERIYRLDLAEESFVAVSLGNLGAGVDVDVHLLRSLDPAQCVARGNMAVGRLVPAGSWFVVVDSWVGGTGGARSGDYTVTIAATAASDLVAHGMSTAVASKALHVFGRAWEAHQTERLEYAVIDFSQPSTTERLWVVDLARQTLLHKLLVAHGSGSSPGDDPRYATVFSNTPESHMSSLGLARTAETYHGQWDYSLRLDGLDPAFNGDVRERAIVLHGADWASRDFLDANGALGLSWGCPTVDVAVATDVIDTLEGGALVWSYYPDAAFEKGSVWLNEPGQ